MIHCHHRLSIEDILKDLGRDIKLRISFPVDQKHSSSLIITRGTSL